MGEPHMAIELLGFPTTLGVPRRAFRHGPEALRAAGLVEKLERHGHKLIDLGDLVTPGGDAHPSTPVRVQQVVEAARWQADTWLKKHRPGNLMLTLGGDHSTSLGSIWALSRMDLHFDVVWIDAHGDFNVIETSPTGNPHGMVLALACGLMPQFLPQLIPSSCLRLWGIRDLDEGERGLLKRERAEVLSPAQIRRDMERVVSRLKPDVFLSFDIDSVEPAEAPGTLTPVPGGFTRSEALELVALIARWRRLLAVDIVEYHPDQDRDSLTVNLAQEVALTAVTGRVHGRTVRV